MKTCFAFLIFALLLVNSCSEPPTGFTGDWALMSVNNKYGGRAVISEPNDNVYEIKLSGFKTSQGGILVGDTIEMTVKEVKYKFYFEDGTLMFQSETDKFVGERILPGDWFDKFLGTWGEVGNEQATVTIVTTEKHNYFVIPMNSSKIFKGTLNGETLEVDNGEEIFRITVDNNIMSVTTKEQVVKFKKL